MAHIAHIDGKFLRVWRDLDVFLGQNKRALLAVQGKHGNAIAYGEHQGGLWPIDTVARGNLLGTLLQKVLLRDLAAFGFAQDAENGSDTHVDIDIARSV